MAAFKVALLGALVATIGLAFFGLQCRSSNRLNVELLSKLVTADVSQQQLKEEGDKLRRDLRVLSHDIADYRDRLRAESDSLKRSKKAEEECKASLEKLDNEHRLTDKEARAREDELEEQQQIMSEKLEQAESDMKMRQDDLLNLQHKLNETLLNLSKAEEKIRLLLTACQGASTIAVLNATAVTTPLPTKSANVSANASTFVKKVASFVTHAAVTDVVVTTASAAAAKKNKTTSVTLAKSDSAVSDDNVTEALDSSTPATIGKDVLITQAVKLPPDDVDANITDADDVQSVPADDEEMPEGEDEGTEGQGR